MPSPNKILIVDDEPRNCKLLETLLSHEGYQTRIAYSGELALAAMKTELPDLVLLDVMMSGMNGFQVAGKIKANPDTQQIPIIMVTALEDRHSMLNALNMGAEEFISKPVNSAELKIRVRNLLRLKEYSDFLAHHNRILNQQVQERTAELRESHIETIFTMTRASERKDKGTGLHIRRISHYCLELAQEMGMDGDFGDTIFYASPMHDIGKIGIPDHILLKPGRHTSKEFEVMKTHSVLGAEILGAGHSPYLKMGRDIALCHHERWNGGGYPNGLKGEEIPLAARIMTICDVYDALRSVRPYKPELDHATAVRIIIQGDERTRPEHFDPAVLNAFQNCTEKFSAI
ncbi:MAG: response regulator, partial [Sulfuricella sp.]|nr:response regulator [Sulfuricella sp.]